MLGLFVLSCIAERQSKMKIRQIRNATLRINFGGVEFLIDPWLISKSEGFTFGQSPFASEVVDPTQFKTYGRLIMDDADVESVCRAAPNATVIASHMDTVAHASFTRKTLRAALERRGLAKRVLMPDDGEVYMF